MANRVAEEPALARPLTNDAADLARSLPDRFFRFQDALKVESRRLAEVAADERPDLLADHFGQVVRVCVGCHAEYLRHARP